MCICIYIYIHIYFFTTAFRLFILLYTYVQLYFFSLFFSLSIFLSLSIYLSLSRSTIRSFVECLAGSVCISIHLYLTLRKNPSLSCSFFTLIMSFHLVTADARFARGDRFARRTGNTVALYHSNIFNINSGSKHRKLQVPPSKYDKEYYIRPFLPLPFFCLFIFLFCS